MTEILTGVHRYRRIEDDPIDVTVVIPTIPSREEWLQRAILTAVRQHRPPKDIIVVTDTERRGAAWARNLGVAQVETEWLAWLDDDDELLPDHLELLHGAAVKTDADLVYSYPEWVGTDDPLACPVNGRLVLPFGVPFGAEQAHHLRHVGNFIPVTYLVRTANVVEVGGMPEPFSPEWPRDCEDWGLLCRLLDANARFVHVPKRTWRYHVHGKNTGGYVGW
jgi:glycosyltransferase involved in cell wall biosynthesis